jgi:C_GCAxxG_C_C family probable redox protein
MTDSIQLANEYFAKGLNCAQAVLAAFASQSGLSEEAALRIAAPFGGGISRRGETCGALAGALMAFGLHYGNESPEAKEETYRISGEFIKRFEAAQGSILCRELLGYDVSTKDGLQAARENKAFANICPRLVEGAARLLKDFVVE